MIEWFLFTIVSCSAAGQGNWIAYSHALKASEYEGLDFRLQASVRTEIDADSASARLWARVDKAEGIGFFNNMWFDPIRGSKWGNYTIEGKIDSGAYQLTFGIICQYNGKFFFDDFKIDIKTKNNEWKNVFQSDFEENINVFEQGIQRGASLENQNFIAKISQDDSLLSNRCLEIVGQGITNFGFNKQAGKFAEVNDIQLYYEVYGEGHPLVILHGNGGSIQDAAAHYEYFIENNYKVIAVDSRAQGKSGDSEVELTYDLLASDINGLLDQLNLDSVYIWGHSDGAIIGLIMALKYPSKVEKLVAFAPNITADSTGIEPIIYRWIEKTAYTSKDQRERKLTTMMLKYPNIPFADLRNIQAQVLLISGDRDFVPLHHMVEIFRNVPHSQLCVIPGSTHGAALEKKDLFLQFVKDFFENPFTMPSTTQWYDQ
jgi:pimeloyl-ACP methyl ester carboxylesterase